MRQVFATTRYFVDRPSVKIQEVVRPNVYHQSFYNNEFIYNLRQDINILTNCQVLLEIEAESNIITEDYLPLRLLESIVLRTVRGHHRICGTEPLYQQLRLDMEDDDFIINATTKPFKNNRNTYYIPIFCFFNEKGLNMSNCEPLEISIKTTNNESFNIVSYSLNLLTEFLVLEYNTYDRIPPIIYDVKSLDRQLIEANSTQTKFRIDAKNFVFAIHLCLNNSLDQFWSINSFDIYIDNTILTTIYPEANYRLYTKFKKKSTMIASYFTSLQIERYLMINPLNFVELHNVYCIIKYDEIPAGYYVNCLLEFYNKTNVLYH